VIVDTHVHAFPYLGGACGRPTVSDHLRRMQRVNISSVNPPRYARDNSVVTEQTLWSGADAGPEGRLDVNFRVGSFGRLEWTAGGEDLYMQWFSPSLQRIESPPDFIVAEMDYAGVDVGILQNSQSYGLLNDYFSECVRRHERRLIGTIQVLEPWAHTDEQMAVLEHGANVLGHRALFYQTAGFWANGYRDQPDEAKYRDFWKSVEQLGLIVYWDISGLPTATAEAYTDQLRRLHRILELSSGLQVIIPMAWPIGFFGRAGHYQLPEIALEVGKLPHVFSELCYPISHGRAWEYPYREAQPYIEQLCEWFGPEKLVWGSDMPNVERFCTYRQSYEYLRHCSFLSPRHLALILGDNAAGLFGLPKEEVASGALRGSS
jgi:predicted TIM-barrel fold metal-dependent hydrolase